MEWTEIVRRRQRSYNRALASAVNRHSISVPIGDSPATAPGYLCLGHFYSCVPDPVYPWDPAVLRAFRSICDDVVPIVIRSVWQWSNYNELGHLGEPMVLVRHGLARAIRNPVTVHNFHCTMPSTPYDGFLIPGRSLAECRPNYIEVNWYDKGDRPFGVDLPGAYLPFDWEMFYRHKEAADEFARDLRRSKQTTDNEGNRVAEGIVDGKAASERAEHDLIIAQQTDQRAYIARDLEKFYSVEPSDVEWKEAYLGDKTPPSTPSISVPALPEGAGI